MVKIPKGVIDATSSSKRSSARNSTKHGITAVTLIDENERTQFASYVDQLTQYYQPQSPLEKLQIERIAMCRSKLSRLYEVEQAKLALALSKLDASPNLVIEQMPHLKELAKSMLLEKVHSGEWLYPCQLSFEQIEAIALEVGNILRAPTNIGGLLRKMPSLEQWFLTYYPIEEDEDNHFLNALHRTLIFLSYVIKNAPQYHHYLLCHTNQFLITQLGDGQIADPKLDLLDEQALEQEIDFLVPTSPGKHLPERPQIGLCLDDVLVGLWVFKALYENAQQAKIAFEQYGQVKELMQCSAQLSNLEADLLMRYQTTLDRRLSSAIGELLQLQKRG